jgi:lysophospholipase L1-like esterase
MTTLRAIFFVLLATVVPVAAEVPQFTRIALMGDSISQLNGDVPSYPSYLKRGLWTTLSSALHQQVDLVYNGVSSSFATSGYRVADVQRVHLPQVLASNAEACIVLAGTNDGDTVATVSGELKQVCDALADHGITPILCDVLPIADGIPSRSAWLVTMKSAIKAICDADPRYIHLDWFNVLDTNNDGVIDQISYFVEDGTKVHPDGDGMSRLGAYAATVLAPHIRPRDPYAGVTWITPNPTLTVTGSGVTPDGWAVDPPPGATVTQSLAPRGDSLGNWWQIGLTGSDPSANAYVRYDYGTYGSGWHAGDAVELVAEFQTDPDISAAWNLRPVMTLYPGPITRIDSEISGTVVTDLLRAPEGMLRTPPIIIPATTTSFSIVLQVHGTGTFRLGRVGIRKLPLTFSTWITGFTSLADLSPDGDPDGDGIPNRLEWILGGDPSVNDSPLLTAIGQANGKPAFDFHQTPRSTQDCDLLLENSADLVSWTDLTLTEGSWNGVTLARDPSDSSHWTATVPAASPASFFRLLPAWKK